MPDSISAILAATAGSVAIFTDFDGTLVEIAPTPDAVAIAAHLPDQLDELFTALDGALAVITGRTVADIDIFLPRQRFSVTGSHGAESRHDGRTASLHPDHIRDAERIALKLKDTLGSEDGVLIEQKPTGVAVHYRSAPEKHDRVDAAVATALDGIKGFKAIKGKKVIEARPSGTDKGRAVGALMAIEPFAGRIPVFLGDDVTDEDGFAEAQRLGGFGIKVGQGESSARFRLPDTAAVHAYFAAIIANEKHRKTGGTLKPNMENMTK